MSIIKSQFGVLYHVNISKAEEKVAENRTQKWIKASLKKISTRLKLFFFYFLSHVCSLLFQSIPICVNKAAQISLHNYDRYESL